MRFQPIFFFYLVKRDVLSLVSGTVRYGTTEMVVIIIIIHTHFTDFQHLQTQQFWCYPTLPDYMHWNSMVLQHWLYPHHL